MTGKRTRTSLSLLLVTLTVSIPTVSTANQPQGTLGRYVPENVWVYVNHVHTPEQDFLSAHWNRVFDALGRTGIDFELKRLISSQIPEEKRAAFETDWETARSYFTKVNWRGLGARELVFAERFHGLMPDMIFLCKPAEATRVSSTENLKNLLKMLEKFGTWKYSERTDRGTSIWAAECTEAPIGLYLIAKENVLGLTIGKTAADDVVNLLGGQVTGSSIVEHPRFLNALKQVPPAESTTAYVDMNRMLSEIRAFPDMIMGPNGSDQSPGQSSKRIVKSIINHLDFLDYAITTTTVRNERECTHKYVKLKNDVSGKPIFKIAADRKPISDFHKYIPVEADSFEASAFIDLTVLYKTIMATIREDLANGPAICDQWQSFQKENGFDLQEDFLSWISGEYIVMSTPPALPTPFCTEDAALLIRVKDPAKAAEKLNAGIQRATAFMSKQNQPLAIKDAAAIPVKGFKTITIASMAMIVGSPCAGIWEDWLVFGSNEAIVRKIMATASGKSQSIRDNIRFQQEGVFLNEPVQSVSFTDLSTIGQQLTGFLVGMGFTAGMIPNEPETLPLKAALNSVGRLSPVVAELNFFKSTSSATVFKNNAWITTSITSYKPASKTTASAAGN